MTELTSDAQKRIEKSSFLPKSFVKVWKSGGKVVTGESEDKNTDSIPEFLGSNTRGLIKITPISSDLEETTFWAENVQVIKELPLKTSDTIDSGSVGYDSTGVPDTSSGALQSENEPRLTIKFDVQVTPNNMTRQDFKTKRADFLFGYDREQVVVTSDMFRKAMPMQFVNIGYTVPSGEESADYQVELTQITTSEELTKQDKEALRTGVGADGHPIQKEGESNDEYLKRQQKYYEDLAKSSTPLE
jgi:hypothetical protein